MYRPERTWRIVVDFLLIDTCVWLNLTIEANESILNGVESGVKSGGIGLIVPATLKVEFERNKYARLKEFQKGIKDDVGRIQSLVRRFEVMEAPGRESLLQQLGKLKAGKGLIRRRIDREVGRITALLGHHTCANISLSGEIKERAAERGLGKKAPFIRGNSTADAVLLESFIEFIAKGGLSTSDRFFFITANKTDFSDAKDDRVPHPDISSVFDGKRNFFEINIAQALNNLRISKNSAETIGEVEKWPSRYPGEFVYLCPK